MGQFANPNLCRRNIAADACHMRRAVNLSAGLIPILHAECTSPVCAERSSAAQHCGSVGNGNFPLVFARIVLIQGTDWMGSGTVTERRFFIYISVLSLMHVPSMCSEAEISRRSKECIPVLTVFLHLVQKWPSPADAGIWHSCIC